jgi:hypothetical protein
MNKLTLSPDVAALNPHLGNRITSASVAKLDTDGYKSELERRFVREWIMPQVSQGMIAAWWYEPMSFNLPGGRYTPDFLILWAHRPHPVTFVEVKGWTKSIRADHRAFTEAAKTHRWASWLWATYQGGWIEEPEK